MCLYTAVAAGGLYSGEVVVWDTSRTKDPVLVQSGMSADSHREPVYHVSPSTAPQMLHYVGLRDPSV